MDLEALRERFLSPPEGSSRAAHCPRPERYLKATLGELPVRENRALADHAATCAACTVTWRLAREYVATADLPSARASGIRRWLWPAAALAAGMAAVALLGLWQQDRPSSPTLRNQGKSEIRSLLAEDRAYPREELVLRWSPGPEGSRYDVRVTDRRLNHVAGGRSLTEPVFPVPGPQLEAIEGGEQVLWQVEMILPDGRRVVSRTFTARLE